jgi:hypothetical protein
VAAYHWEINKVFEDKIYINYLKYEVKNAVRSSKKTQHVSMTTIKWLGLMVFKE